MTYWKEYDFMTLSSMSVKKGKKEYDDNIFTLDIETTSIFYDGHNYTNFDYSKNPEHYATCEKYGICYIWQFSINETVLYGRYLHELYELIEIVHNIVENTMIIYIHNLAFEFQFLRNIFKGLKPFARKPRHPIKAFYDELSIEFRCSLTLFNMKLAKLPENLGLSVTKKEGQLEYNKLRLPCTPLTDYEMEYCEYDCIVLYESIKVCKAEYEHVHNIPLTQTGKLRRIVKSMYKNNNAYYRKLCKMLPRQYDEFNLLCKAYSGGYTHANALYTGQILDSVYSNDITSSYPTVMIAEKYPMSRFVKKRVNSIDDIILDKAYIVDITFKDLQALTSCTYLSKSKAIQIYNGVEDNGRIVCADSARYVLTEIDLDIVKRSYKFDYELNCVYVAYKEMLDTNLIKYILQLYADKTMYKNVSGKTDLYRTSKELINAMYGMCVTNTIRDEVDYSDNGWEVVPLTREQAEEKLNELATKRKTFLYYAWGVWVTAYARKNLWDVMLKLPDDVVYTDTDSIKYVHQENQKYFDEYNIEIVKKLESAMEYHGINKKHISPCDPKKKPHTLGVYDYEGMYDKFITLGAKKYCAVKHDDIEITISGVQKKSGAKAIEKIENFREGFTFDYNHSGRLIMSYNDAQPEITFTDYLGNTETVNQQYGINAMPTTYTLGISSAYSDYLTRLSGQTSTHLSILEE